MKKVVLIASILLVAGISGLFAQKPQINPIPSFNYPVTSLMTAFQEQKYHGAPQREKREIEVVISSSSSNPGQISAQIWLVKENALMMQGPFTIYLDELWTSPIDNGQWGVIPNRP